MGKDRGLVVAFKEPEDMAREEEESGGRDPDEPVKGLKDEHDVGRLGLAEDEDVEAGGKIRLGKIKVLRPFGSRCNRTHPNPIRVAQHRSLDLCKRRKDLHRVRQVSVPRPHLRKHVLPHIQVMSREELLSCAVSVCVCCGRGERVESMGDGEERTLLGGRVVWMMKGGLLTP